MNDRQMKKDMVNLKIALAVSELATCARHKVGAVVSREGRILATGRNGVASGQEHCEDLMEGGMLSYEEHAAWSKANERHAERNAIDFCKLYDLPTRDATIYVTHSPCADCARLIIDAGISRVVFIERYDGEAELRKLYDRHGVEVVRFDISLRELRERMPDSDALFEGIRPEDVKPSGLATTAFSAPANRLPCDECGGQTCHSPACSKHPIY